MSREDVVGFKIVERHEGRALVCCLPVAAMTSSEPSVSQGLVQCSLLSVQDFSIKSVNIIYYTSEAIYYTVAFFVTIYFSVDRYIARPNCERGKIRNNTTPSTSACGTDPYILESIEFDALSPSKNKWPCGRNRTEERGKRPSDIEA